MISYCLNFHFCSFQSQCDELSDNTTYLKIATDKLLNGILDFSKNNLDEHFISQEIVKEALTKMNQNLIGQGKQIDVRPQDYFKQKIGVARSLDKELKLVTTLFVPLANLGQAFTVHHADDDRQYLAGVLEDLKNQFGMDESTWEAIQSTIDGGAFSLFALVFFLIKRLSGQVSDNEKDQKDLKDALDELNKEIKVLKGALEALNEARLDAMKDESS